MTNIEKQQNIKTEQHKNVFTQIKKASKRGRGLAHPPDIKLAPNNINKQEGAEAVEVKNKRTTRISTYITNETGDMIKKTTE